MPRQSEMTPHPARGERLDCAAVLERLPDYLEGALTPATVGAVEHHLRTCENCARFGGSYQALVATLRAPEAADEPA